ncbi:macro domain-containing protein [Burkholderia ambifaria]|uniref:macro domain-containing protein n=1 Tax=Burkholderia ambifaria TaxID=152480 RepID=UPI00158A8553|nr:macro domain-containing protein [Burkholderia ambifaria]
MKLTLCATSAALADAFRSAFAEFDDVEVMLDDILKFQADAVVSPANSFGWMDGGIDLHYRNHFGLDLERRVVAEIAQRPNCMLLVGEAIVVPTGDGAIPSLIVAPTMCVPSVVANSDNAYRAFSAALRAAKSQGFAHVLSPGMCTGVGRMPPHQAAAQMARAWREHISPASIPADANDPTASMSHGERCHYYQAVGYPNELSPHQAGDRDRG